eukprot:6255723-Heterocapsa_arctica.AAC.1
MYELGEGVDYSSTASRQRRLREETAAASGSGVDTGPHERVGATLVINHPKNGYPQLARTWVETKGLWDYVFI